MASRLRLWLINLLDPRHHEYTTELIDDLRSRLAIAAVESRYFRGRAEDFRHERDEARAELARRNPDWIYEYDDGDDRTRIQ